ncbi:Ig-like domain-containing protein [Mangrovicoccus ximenensis]|uniref:Ig-like domain-containing protein n=1 Tax=Mangrovicoccus ximenensis TaxID=1911570 RepID=UPI000D3A0F21|nr:tandem-95 repeat protein [Mangrovicoccus ximenensis]
MERLAQHGVQEHDDRHRAHQAAALAHRPSSNVLHHDPPGCEGAPGAAADRVPGHPAAGPSQGALELGEGVAPGDVRVRQSSDGAAMILHLGFGGDRVRIEDAMGGGQIEIVRFADGTEWRMADLLARVASGLDDWIFGDGAANPLAGGPGDDRISGGEGDDIYRFAAGDGRDILRDAARSGADELRITGYLAADIRFARLGTGSTDIAIQFEGSRDQILVVDGLDLAGRGIERIVLEDDGTVFTIADIAAELADAQLSAGDDTVIGTGADETLGGGTGDDLVSGGGGDDLYRYAAGDGDDRIEALGGGDSEVLLADYGLADLVSAVRAGPESPDLVLNFTGDGDRLVLADALGPRNGSPGSLVLRFAGGPVWGRDEMRARALQDIEGAGDDSVWGFGGADVITLGAGDDFASGNAGADTYVITSGGGADRIEDTGADPDETDILDLTGFDAGGVSVERLFRGSSAVELGLGGGQSVLVLDALAPGGQGIERYRFAGGVTWGKDTLLQLLDNSAPVANDDGFFAVTTGAELVLPLAELLANDFDADGDPLAVIEVDGSPDGTATLDGDGNLVFVSKDGFTGATTIAYRIADGRNGFASASVNVSVRPVAEARDDGGFSVAEDGFLAIRAERLLSNDIDGDRMIVGQVFGAEGGTVSLSSDGTIGFTPDADHNGPAQFAYAANTPEGGRAEATVFIEVTPVNDAPEARPDRGFAMDEGGTLVINAAALTGNDIDIDGDVLALSGVGSSAELIATLTEAGEVELAARGDFFGAASFAYTVADPSGAEATGTVSVTVRPVNDAPLAADDRFELTQAGDPILEDNPVVLSLARLTANDTDPDGDPLSLAGVRAATGGRATLLENQTVLFEPTANFNGEAGFTYRVDDGQGGSAEARATILYQAVNDRPNARNDRYSSESLWMLRGTQDVPLEISLLDLIKNDSDPEGSPLGFENATGAVNGDLAVADGVIIFTPDPGFAGEATFGYSVTDPEGEVDGAQVTLFFAATGDTPPDPESDQVLIPEDIPTVIRLETLLGNDMDLDGDDLEILGWRPLNGLGDVFKFGGAAAGPMNGTLDFNAEGDLLYTPHIDATFSSGFVYLVSDGEDGTAEAFVDIVIVPSNDEPEAVEDPGFVTPFDVPLVIRAADLVFNDYDIEQADRDGDGTVDADLDDPDRPRPVFVGVDAIYDPVELAQGHRVEVGAFEIVNFRGEAFLVARFDPGFAGPVTIQYRIADAEGLEDTGFAHATVADYYGQELSGTPQIDYIEGNALSETIRGYRRDDWILGRAGDDTIESGAGDDLIMAGQGDDVIDPGDGGDDVRGGTGFDLVRFAGSNTGVRADLLTLVGQGGHAQGDLYVDIEGFEGSDYADTLGGDGRANLLRGMDGRDGLEGRGGDDTLEGGAGSRAPPPRRRSAPRPAAWPHANPPHRARAARPGLPEVPGNMRRPWGLLPRRPSR